LVNCYNVLSQKNTNLQKEVKNLQNNVAILEKRKYE